MSEVPADASFGEYPRAARSVGHVSSRVSPVVDSLRCWRRRHPSVDPLAVGRRADRHNRALAARHTQIVLLLGDESNDRRPGPVELDSKVVLSRSYWRGAAPPSATSHRGAGRVDCSPQYPQRRHHRRPTTLLTNLNPRCSLILVSARFRERRATDHSTDAFSAG
jgi:hypothetical protein